jgi:2-methylcitrate dehydratase PrpD
LLRGRFTLDELEDEAIGDREVLALARRVNYAADPASTFPKHYTGEVIVTLNDGRQMRHREGVNRGCADRPLSNSEIEAKYFDNACRLLTREIAENVRNTVVGIDRGSAPALADVLAQSAK